MRLSYKVIEDAVRIANDVRCGRAAYIFGSTQERLKVAPRLQAGIVQINGGGSLRPDTPCGAQGRRPGLADFHGVPQRPGGLALQSALFDGQERHRGLQRLHSAVAGSPTGS